jgi:hypothetical protein
MCFLQCERSVKEKEKKRSSSIAKKNDRKEWN